MAVVLLGACGPHSTNVERSSASDPAVQASEPTAAPSCAALVDEQVAALNTLLEDFGPVYDRWFERLSTGPGSKKMLAEFDALKPGEDLDLPDLPPRIMAGMSQEGDIHRRFERRARAAGCTPREVAELENDRAFDIRGTSHLADMYRFRLAQPYRSGSDY